MIRPATIVRIEGSRLRFHVRQTFVNRGEPTALLDVIGGEPGSPNAMLVPLALLTIDEEATSALEARWGDPAKLEAHRAERDRAAG